MATQIDWTDSVGAATLTNGKPVPADRFASWTPRNETVGPRAHALADGSLHRFRFRTDYRARFELRGIPNTDMDKVLRLIEHLENEGTCQVTTGDSASRVYATCGLAPDGTLSYDLTDRAMLEYTLTLDLVNLAVSPTAMLCIY